jgi:heptosyltransferase III
MTFGNDPVSKPSLLTKFRRSDGARKFGRLIERGIKKALFAVLGRVLPYENRALSELRQVNKVLMVRPNFRIGNTLIAARLIPSIQARFPEARIDFLGAETTLTLLENMGLGKTEALSRSHSYRLFSFLCMILRLRKERYDIAIDCGRGSKTSAVLTSLIGSRYRVGVDRGGGRRLLNVRLSIDRQPHVYDNFAAFARELRGGGEAPAIPYYQVSGREILEAKAWLCDNGLGQNGKPVLFVAVFVGGHLGKRWSGRIWRSFLRKLDAAGVPLLVFSGPEEFALLDEIRELKLQNVFIAPVQKLRPTAALYAQARLVVSPDTGFLHLAAALELPVVSVLQTERSQTYAPKGERDRSLLRPSVDEVVHALTTHPDWPGPPR